MIINKGNFIFVLNKRVFMLKGKKWAFYFPSSFFIGSYGIAGIFKNWSFCYFTLERKER